ncbi:MAG: hypothetical protein LBC45_02425 [Chlamydiales bacterium]|jgi:hypothetical protein|nr:hypothetical protein [Chlamydiales bacterium]
MGLKEECQQLSDLFHRAAEGQSIDLQQVFTQSLQFFERLKVELKEEDPQRKQEALAMLMEIYQNMIKDTKLICETSEMTEEQLIAFAENPANFSPEQWLSIQESREKIFHAGEDLAKALEQLSNFQTGKKPHDPSKKIKKSDWIRS